MNLSVVGLLQSRVQAMTLYGSLLTKPDLTILMVQKKKKEKKRPQAKKTVESTCQHLKMILLEIRP